MSKFEQKEGSFSIFRNEDKEHENQPDYTGTGKWKGQEVRLACWLKETQNGKKFFSGKFSEPYKKEKTLTEEVGEDLEKELNDEIPF